MSEFYDAHWRDSQRTIRFFGLDARAAFFFFLAIIHMRLWTFSLALAVSMIFWVLERKGLSFPVALRSFRRWLLGRRRPAVAFYKRRRLTDYGS